MSESKVFCLLCDNEMKKVQTKNNTEYFTCLNPKTADAINAPSRHLMVIDEYEDVTAGKRHKEEIRQIMGQRAWFLTSGDANVLGF